MSRSFKKTPIIGYTKASSEKWDKRKANRRFRRATKVETQKGNEFFTLRKRQTTAWDMKKDGRQYMNVIDIKEMRK